MNKVILLKLIILDKVTQYEETGTASKMNIPESNIPFDIDTMIQKGQNLDTVLANTSKLYKAHVEPSNITGAGDGLFATENIAEGKFNYKFQGIL